MNESIQEKTERIEKGKARDKERRMNESIEERTERIAKGKARDKERRMRQKLEHGSLYLKAYSKEASFYKLSDFTSKCMHCPALHFEEEKSKTKTGNMFNECCNYGNFSNLEELIEDYPDSMKNLFDPNDNLHKEFIKSIRTLNSNFSCASLGCMRFRFPNRTVPIFKIQGNVYHSYNTVACPDDDGTTLPTNGQLYFVDTEQSLGYRSDALSGDSANGTNDNSLAIIAYIEAILREHYVFAKSYQMLKDVISEAEENANKNGTCIPDVSMLFGIREGTDIRRYNIPRSNDVCAILFMDANDEIPAANFIVHSKGEKISKDCIHWTNL